MKRLPLFVLAVATAACVIASAASTAVGAGDDAAPIYGITIPPGYRQWELISVAHEAANYDDIRAMLGNPIAMTAFRNGTLPFPDGAIIARLAWKYVPSAQNDKVFGREQSFIAGPATNVQFMVKDSKKYAATGGWGYAEFIDGKPAGEAVHKTCFPCHVPAKAQDYVFTRYAP
ncbi:MAG: cytochrome P460 family protein [Candidatus Acidiferrales bacterium]